MTTETTTNGLPENNAGTPAGKISLETLSRMTGFPVEIIKDEIFQGKGTDDISLEELRSAMLNYIDSAILIKDEN